MMSDQKSSAKGITFSTNLLTDKLVIQVNDNATYKGQILCSPYYDLHDLKAIFDKGDVEICAKTTNKLIIKVAFLKFQLLNQDAIKIKTLEKKIQELQNKLQNIGKQKWQEQDLNSTANFDTSCIYKVDFTNGHNMSTVGVNTTTLYFNYSGSSYTTTNTNRRANTTGWVVKRIVRLKI